MFANAHVWQKCSSTNLFKRSLRCQQQSWSLTTPSSTPTPPWSTSTAPSSWTTRPSTTSVGLTWTFQGQPFCPSWKLISSSWNTQQGLQSLKRVDACQNIFLAKNRPRAAFHNFHFFSKNVVCVTGRNFLIGFLIIAVEVDFDVGDKKPCCEK